MVGYALLYVIRYVIRHAIRPAIRHAIRDAMRHAIRDGIRPYAVLLFMQYSRCDMLYVGYAIYVICLHAVPYTYMMLPHHREVLLYFTIYVTHAICYATRDASRHAVYLRDTKRDVIALCVITAIN